MPLTLFLAYRFIVALLLLFLFLNDLGPAFLGQSNSKLYTIVAISYLGFVLAGIPLLVMRTPSVNTQTLLMLITDIACITLLLFASGGIESGLGTLLAVSIAAGSLIIPGGNALLIAAIATLALLGQQMILNTGNIDPTSAYPQAGLLGASFFAIAILAHVLSRRLSHSEQLINQQELDLANLAELNEYIIQHMQTGILVVDGEGRVRLINEAAWYLLGMPDAGRGKQLMQAAPALAVQMERWQDPASPPLSPFRPTPGGRELKAGFSQLGKHGVEGTIVFIEDAASVTQQAQQMKLASLGRLTASIAHEIRNPLGAIGHAQQLLNESPDLPVADRRLVEIISTNTGRVNDIIENVLQLSRRQQANPKEFAIAPWLKTLVDDFLHSRELTSNQILLQIDPVSTMIFADPSQLRQIFTNLCENAVQHFDRELEKLRIILSGGVTPSSGGPYLELVDNGPGIPTEAIRQIFEPFFTTDSEGTGLGLYIAKELSESNRIRLEYLPIATGGSCFRMNFPGVRTSGWKQG